MKAVTESGDKMERLARSLIILLLLVAVAIPLLGRWFSVLPSSSAVVLRARLAERGGWSRGVLEATTGEPLSLRMTSDDVIHAFSVGRHEAPSVDVEPGKWTTTSLIFDRPGTYTFYCSRWCGPEHWRMRGTIEVTGQGEPLPTVMPRYLEYGIDIDAPQPTTTVPESKPQAQRGVLWRDVLPDYVAEESTYWRHSPSELWVQLRGEEALQHLADMDIWDAVAWVWAVNTTPSALFIGQQLYEQEAAAAHGEMGRGDGVMARDLPAYDYDYKQNGHSAMRPPDFAAPEHMFGASPARLEGKLLRGGMGTGMPAYGEIFSQEEIAGLVAYLYTFVMSMDLTGTALQ